MLEPGNIINLYNRPVTSPVAAPQGLQSLQPGGWLTPGYRPTSSTYSATLDKNDDERLKLGGRFASKLAQYGPNAAVLLPTVVNGKFLTDQEAANRWLNTGEHLGVFDRWQSAEPYATQLHNSQAAKDFFYGKTSQLAPQPPPK
jgi:hypothetical protein